MRVVQLNSVYRQGSTGRIAARIHEGLLAAGHDSHVIYGRGQERDEPGLHVIGSEQDMKAHGALTRTLDRHGLGSAGMTRRIVETLGRLRPDVVHLHNIHGYWCHYPILFDHLRASGASVVWTLHDCWAFTGHCAYFTYAGCERWRDACGSCPQLRTYPASLVVDRSRANLADKRRAFSGLPDVTLAAPSRWLTELARESFLGEYPAEVVRNDVDAEVFRPRPSDFRARHGLEDKVLLLAVANIWEPRKGLAHLRELRLRDDEALVVVGRLEEDDALPTGAVHVPATQDAVELAEIYTAADLFLNPTLEDNYPTTNLEALACGTPVVTFPTGGSPEALERGHGLVATECSAAALREAVDDARERAWTGTTLATPGAGMVADYLALYERVSGRHRGR